MPGRENIMADVLSRLHDDETCKKTRDVTRVVINALNYVWTPEIQEAPRELPSLQEEDKRILKIKKDTMKSEEDTRYKLLGDKLYRMDAPRLDKLTRQFLHTCDSCQRNKILTTVSQAIIEPVLSEKPLEILSIDFFGHMTKSKFRYEYLLVMIDTFSKYTKCFPLRNATCDAAIKKIDEFIENIGKLDKVLSDWGTQFTCKRWKQALDERGIKRILTSIRYPQANMVQRVNREITRLFRTLSPPEKHSTWFTQLENMKKIMNESYHNTTETTPYEAVWDRKPVRWWEQFITDTPPHHQANRQEKIVITREGITNRREKLSNNINLKKKESHSR